LLFLPFHFFIETQRRQDTKTQRISLSFNFVPPCLCVSVLKNIFAIRILLPHSSQQAEILIHY
jgi:hypothetical protein